VRQGLAVPRAATTPDVEENDYEVEPADFDDEFIRQVLGGKKNNSAKPQQVQPRPNFDYVLHN
jgi:hypothetical protein